MDKPRNPGNHRICILRANSISFGCSINEIPKTQKERIAKKLKDETKFEE